MAQDDPGANPRGLALRIETDDGMDLVGHSAGGFPASDPEGFLAFIEALNAEADDPEQPHRQAIERSAARRSEAPRAVVPRSFASMRYHMLHAYALTDAGGQRTVGRLTVEPASGEDASPSFSGPNCMDEELRHRLERRVVAMALSFVPAKPGDPTDDIAAPWSGDRVAVGLGVLSFDRVAADQDRQGALAFDPSRLPRGVGFAGDPMIEPRIRAYRLAAERRSGR